MQNIKVADWLVHGGHQYEFFKVNKSFLCTGPDRRKPDHKALGRPLNRNVKYVDGKELLRSRFDIVMVRAGVDYSYYNKKIMLKRTPGIAVMQTHLPYEIPAWTKAVVWNSKVVMDRYKSKWPRKKHFYIPHGFDPSEFKDLGMSRNGRVLSAAALFKQRQRVMGYEEWRWVADHLKVCDLLGHGNDDIKEAIGSFPLDDLVKKYNQYSVFFNTTTRSAMPRVRGEALMCGTPLVTTKNFGIENYLEDKKHCLYADSKSEMLECLKKVLSSNSLQQDLGAAGREVAIKSFNIKEYKSRWEDVFSFISR